VLGIPGDMSGISSRFLSGADLTTYLEVVSCKSGSFGFSGRGALSPGSGLDGLKFAAVTDSGEGWTLAVTLDDPNISCSGVAQEPDLVEIGLASLPDGECTRWSALVHGSLQSRLGLTYLLRSDLILRLTLLQIHRFHARQPTSESCGCACYNHVEAARNWAATYRALGGGFAGRTAG